MTDTIEQTMAALGDPTRVSIVNHLSRGAASVTELAADFPMSLRGVLKHVQVLEDAGLVRTTKVGRVRRCELQAPAFDEATRWISDVRRRWEGRLDRLDHFVRNEQEDT
jgi:DNA-binding transcriptional ArsR family regulator